MITIILSLLIIFFTVILFYNIYSLFFVYEGHSNISLDKLVGKNEINNNDIKTLNSKLDFAKKISDKFKLIKDTIKNNNLEIIRFSEKIQKQTEKYVGGDPKEVAENAKPVTGLSESEYQDTEENLRSNSRTYSAGELEEKNNGKINSKDTIF